jgi:hypothetical protein
MEPGSKKDVLQEICNLAIHNVSIWEIKIKFYLAKVLEGYTA